jgi:4-carboxymuconolactone decarboxylase
MATKLFEEGLKVRKAVIGEEYVEKAFKEADEFSRPFQELHSSLEW